MRKFFDKIQKNHRKRGLNISDYFWKYEQGKTTNRSHVHCFYSSEMYNGLFPFNDNLKPKFKKYKNGISWLVSGFIPAVPISLHKEFMSTWNSGYISIEPINSRGVLFYVKKYFTKKGATNKRLPPKKDKYYKDLAQQKITKRKGAKYIRRWGCSRSIEKAPKNYYSLFIDKSYDQEYLYALSENLDFTTYLPPEFSSHDPMYEFFEN
jgi:hypothetical protein